MYIYITKPASNEIFSPSKKKNTSGSRCTEFQFIGITTLHVSGSLSAPHQEFLAVHRFWYILCSCDERLLPGVGWNAVPSYSW